MSDIERSIGRIEAKLDAQMDFETKEHAKIDSRFDKLEQKVDSLRLWKASMLGVSGVFGALIGYLIKLI